MSQSHNYQERMGNHRKPTWMRRVNRKGKGHK